MESAPPGRSRSDPPLLPRSPAAPPASSPSIRCFPLQILLRRAKLSHHPFLPMASDAPAQQPAPQQKPTRVSLSYEEISKLFSLPIAEAASILGMYNKSMPVPCALFPIPFTLHAPLICRSLH